MKLLPAVLLLQLALTGLHAQEAAPAGPAADRAYLVEVLTKTSRPVLEGIATGTFFEKLPKRDWESGRRNAAYAEALGRTLAGIAPWLALPPDDTPEGQLRAEYADLARRALIAAADPSNKDYKRFTMSEGKETNRQFLVETAYIAQAMLRAPNVFWEPLTAEQRANVLKLFDTVRPLEPVENNWLLFASIVEAARWKFYGDYDKARFEYGINKHLEWYLSDGMYSDGPHYRWDYYNSYSIQPMLIDVLAVAKEKGDPLGRHYEKAVKRMQRYAEVLERLISPEGTFPVVGRSSAYRYGAFQALSQIILMRQLPPDTEPAGARDGLTAVIRRTSEFPGTYDAEGWLDIGAVGRQPSIRDPYNGTGALYIALNGLLHLGLPADDPFWTAPPGEWTQKRIWSGQDIERDTPLGD
jgi:hypothetical protein